MARMRPLRIIAWAAAALTVGGLALAIWLDARAGAHGTDAWEIAGWVTATLVSAGVGLMLATRRGSNPIGWLLLVNGLVLTAMGLSDSYADYAVLAHPGTQGGAWAVLFSERAWPLLFAPLTAIAWVFPDGRLPSPRWRPFAIAGAASFAVLVGVSLLAAERFSAKFDHVASPLPELSESAVGIPFP